MKRGSALLIVLGMMAFMLFSGLAFSVYMRQTRLPSSFLRRTTVTRELAKAALAMAVADIDDKIGNDIHPGVTFKNRDEQTEEDGENAASETRDTWRNRVFLGAKGARGNINTDSLLVEDSTTVPILTLEGVAYLPPSLINEARYYFRRTPTAQWHRFAFDAGRYAYAALDVSDYFDVNKTVADSPRSSAGSKRVTLAHLFERTAHRQGPEDGPEQWDRMLEEANVRTVDDNGDVTLKMPLVSLADFNLALAEQTFGDLKSPFIQYIASTKGDSGYYPGISDSDTDAKAAAYRSMTFVTDSLNAPQLKSETDGVLSLESGDGQPFTRAELQKEGQNLHPILNHSTDGGFGKVCGTGEGTFLCRLGACQLYDYLDKNDVPLSLAIPTVERTPMVCGAQLNIPEGKFTVTRMLDPEAAPKEIKKDSEKKTRTVERTYKYYLTASEGLGQMVANVMTLYPFRKVENPGAFKIGGAVGFFLAEHGEDASKNVGLRYGKYAKSNPLLARTLLENDSSGILNNSVVKTAIPQQACTVPSDPKTSEKAVSDPLPLASDIGIVPREMKRNPVLTVKFQWEQQEETDADGNGTGVYHPEKPWEAKDYKVVEASRGIKALGTNGSALDDPDKAKIEKNIDEGVAVDPTFALWVRIKDANGKVVDLAPATMFDDQLNGINNDMCVVIDRDTTGEGVPILKIATGISNFKISVKNLEDNVGKELALDPAPKAMMIRDPRFNHDSRSWQVMTETFDAAGWIKSCGCTDDGCDGDVFMATSGQEYLQSHYELAHMLRLTNPFGDAGSFGSDVAGNLSKSWDYRDLQTGKALNDGFFWKTYSPFKVGKRAADDFESLELTTGTTGVRVNPYSDSEEVLMAAFANTPLDWRHASTNYLTNAKAFNLDISSFNTKYAWCQYAESGHKVSWDTLCAIADAFSSKVRSSDSWETAFGDLGWDITETDRIVSSMKKGSDDDAIFTSVDRRFLYGFWHECFAARQQLFLVFVRAEPMMMGGGVVGMAPPQLGSRAVALVWRDPRAVTANVCHPTRVLFYHPLD